LVELTQIQLFGVEKHVCLSRDVEVANATWRATMKIEARIGDLVWRFGGDQAQVGTQWPDDQEFG
jgi:hypothetical protein